MPPLSTKLWPVASVWNGKDISDCTNRSLALPRSSAGFSRDLNHVVGADASVQSFHIHSLCCPLIIRGCHLGYGDLLLRPQIPFRGLNGRVDEKEIYPRS